MKATAMCHLPLLFGLMLGSAACAAALPRNPGFEQVREGTELPADWSERGLGSAVHRLSPEARTGQWAAQITTTEPMAGYYYSHPEPLPAAGRLTVSAWVRVKAEAGGAYLILYYLQGEKLEQYLSPRRQSELISDTGGKWRRVTISDVPPPEAQGWRMSVEFDGVGTALWDDAEAVVELVQPLPGISLATPSGKVVDLGEGRRGAVWAVQPVRAGGQQLRVNLQGASAVPPVCQVGAVWFAGDRQLGVTSVSARAWQTPTGVTCALRPIAGATHLRPLVMTDSPAAWHALTIGMPRTESAGPAPLPPLGGLPRGHPRLFVTPGELSSLRQKLHADPPPPQALAYKRVVNWADSCFDKREIRGYRDYGTTLPPAVPPRHEDDFPYWTGLSRAIENDIEVLATAYLLTGERRYANLAKTWTLALCAWPQWTDPDYSSRDACLDTGHFCHAAAFAYDFCYDALTEAERQIIRNALLEKGAASVLRAGEEGWARDMSWPNGFAVVMGGMGIAGLATLGDDPRAEQYVQYARRRLHEFLGAQDRDGGYVEGLVYGGYAISYTMPFAGTLALHGDRALVDHPYLAKTLRMACMTMQPGDQTAVDFCDSVYESRDYASLAAWRAREGDAAGLWYLEQSGLRGTLPQWTPPLGVLWEPDQPVASSTDDWPAAAHYRDIGWVVMRSGFGLDDFLFALRCGYYGSHCQSDNASFMLNTGKQWALRDPGYGVYATEEHSTLLVDGQGRSTGSGEIAAFGTVGPLTYAAADATASYPSLRRFVRHVVMVERDYLLVVDEIAARDEARVTSQLVTGLEQVEVTDGRRVVLCQSPPWELVAAMPGELRVVGDVGPRKLQASFTVGQETVFTAMLIGPGTGDLTMATSQGAVGLVVRRGGTTDHFPPNVSGRTANLQEVTSDARLALVRTRNGQPGSVTAIWGSHVSFAGETLLQRPRPGDFSARWRR